MSHPAEFVLFANRFHQEGCGRSGLISRELAKSSRLLFLNRRHPAQKTMRWQSASYTESCLAKFQHGAREEAFYALERMCARTIEFNRLFGCITRSRLYRWWRERRESKRSVKE